MNPKGPKHLYLGILTQTIIVTPIIEKLKSNYREYIEPFGECSI